MESKKEKALIKGQSVIHPKIIFKRLSNAVKFATQRKKDPVAKRISDRELAWRCFHMLERTAE